MADVDLNELIDTADSGSSHKQKKAVHKHLAHKTAQHSDAKHSARPSSGGKATVWILGIVCVLLIGLLVASILTHGFNPGSSSGVTATASANEVKAKTLTYLEAIAPGQQVSVDEVKDNGTFYAVKINLAGHVYDSFASKDGAYLFPSGIDLNQKVEPAPEVKAPEVPKTDKPVAELFIMSYCPYGTQAEKGILPAIRALGDTADVKIRFTHFTLHGEKEDTENFRQICIREEQPTKFLPYLACTLNSTDPNKPGDVNACMQKTGVDAAKVSTCITDNAAKYYAVDSQLSQKYGVQGSPTLIINGVQSGAGRNPASYLSGICDAFNNAPKECSTQLSSTNPGPGFGYDSTSAATAAGCGV